ncbi:MAG: ASKHA domain-containing protein [Pseudomonadota bacterium]
MTDPLILFMPSGKRGRFPVGTPVLDAARELGVYVESVCGGRGVCGRCQVEVAEGQFAKHGITSACENLSEFGPKETRYAEKRSLKPGRRLSCSATVRGDLVIDVPQDVAVNASMVRKAADTRSIERDPAVTLCYVEVEEPDMHNPLGDADRLIKALATEWGLQNVGIDFHLYAGLQKTLRADNWRVTAAIHRDRETDRETVIALWPGLKNEAYGLAVDIGSTTIAVNLVSLLSGRIISTSGAANPQIRFGEDLMSRVSYVMMNPSGCDAMTKAVREAIDELAEKACAEAEIATQDILDAVFVANPVMHHLFLGIDPTELGGAPFALASSGPVSVTAQDLGLSFNRGARVYLLPCIAGHVGADAAAVTLAEAPQNSDDLMLVVDVGTNAEIVLGSKDRVLAASSPTGPAFEGAEISCGQRAAPGAIERLRIDPVTLEPRFRVIGSEAWSDEPQFEAQTEKTGVTGLCGSAIIEVIAEMYLARIITEDGIIDGTRRAQSPRIIQDGRTFSYVIRDADPMITVTQNDVRAIQLAKAALYAGVKLLMEKAATDKVAEIRLAGAFGSFIDPKYAMILGLIPDCDLDRVSAVGNAAGIGARMALLNRGHRRSIEKTVCAIEKIETALEPNFQGHFVNAMALPNKADPFPNLASAVTLPERSADNATDAEQPVRRRRRSASRRAVG